MTNGGWTAPAEDSPPGWESSGCKASAVGCPLLLVPFERPFAVCTAGVSSSWPSAFWGCHILLNPRSAY